MTELGDQSEKGIQQISSQNTEFEGKKTSKEGATVELMQQFMTQMFQLMSEMTEKQLWAAAEERAMERARQEERKRLAEVNTENMQIMMQQLREVIMPLPRLDKWMEERAA